jgi:hypothetical protein
MERNINAEISKNGKAPLQGDHRDDLPPIGSITKCWIDPLPGKPGEHALFIEFEFEEGHEDKKGFSVAFFGHGYGHGELPAGQDRPDILFGYRPGTLSDGEAQDLLDVLVDETPARAAAVREYREHSVDSLAVGVWFVLVSDYLAAGMTKTIADGLVDRIVALLFRAGKPRVAAIKVRAHGDKVAMRIPVDADSEVAKTALREAFKTLRENHGKR